MPCYGLRLFWAGGGVCWAGASPKQASTREYAARMRMCAQAAASRARSARASSAQSVIGGTRQPADIPSGEDEKEEKEGAEEEKKEKEKDQDE